MTHKRTVGQMAYYSGQSAEDQVAADYQRRGHRLEARRWRGAAGEVDLVFSAQGEVVFVEVERANSFASAAQRISKRQQTRICNTAEEYLGTQPRGMLTPMRVDAAFVNGQGEIRILENAIGHF